jgi:hypothetical protein
MQEIYAIVFFWKDLTEQSELVAKSFVGTVLFALSIVCMDYELQLFYRLNQQTTMYRWHYFSFNGWAHKAPTVDGRTLKKIQPAANNKQQSNQQMILVTKPMGQCSDGLGSHDLKINIGWIICPGLGITGT